MSISSDTRNSQVGRYSSDYDFGDSFFQEIFFEVGFIERTYSSFCDSFFFAFVSKFFHEFDWPSIFSEDSHTRSSLKTRGNTRTIIVVLMKSEMNPYDFFIIFSKKINESFRVSDNSILFTKLSHTLSSDLSVRVEKFIYEVDDDKGASHRFLLEIILPLPYHYGFSRIFALIDSIAEEYWRLLVQISYLVSLSHHHLFLYIFRIVLGWGLLLHFLPYSSSDHTSYYTWFLIEGGGVRVVQWQHIVIELDFLESSLDDFLDSMFPLTRMLWCLWLEPVLA